MRRRTDERDGRAVRVLLVLSLIVGLLMMVLGVAFRVYVCHWVAKAMFAGWIGIFTMITAGLGMCLRISQTYGPRPGPAIVLVMSFINFCFCVTMVACLAFAMNDFIADKWYRTPQPYLTVDPDHCVVERHVNRHNYYNTIIQHGRDGLRIGSVLIGVGILEMILTLLRCLFIGRVKGFYGKSEYVRQEEPRRNANV